MQANSFDSLVKQYGGEVNTAILVAIAEKYRLQSKDRFLIMYDIPVYLQDPNDKDCKYATVLDEKAAENLSKTSENWTRLLALFRSVDTSECQDAVMFITGVKESSPSCVLGLCKLH